MSSESVNKDAKAGGISPNGETIPVIIAGAGPVGLLLALLLARKGIASKVFERGSEVDTSPRAADAGIYDIVRERGFQSGGHVWRKPIVDDGKGGKALGPAIAELKLGEPGPDGSYKDGECCIIFTQGRLVQVLLEEAAKTGLVEILFSTPITGIEQDESGVTVQVEASGQPQSFRSRGHSWPERLIAVDVLRTLPKLEETPAYFAVDKVHWGVIIPLEPIFPGKPGLWRYGMAIPDEKMTAEEAQDPKYVEELLLRYIDGPRPVEHTVVRSRLYRLHQLLASTMHRGRVLLAGDAAHVNSPVGGLGLCTGLLDVDILSQALDLILNHDYHDPQDLLAEYSAARRFVFQNFINPTSTANKLRLHESDPDNAAQEDWFLRMVRKGDRQEIANALAPLQRRHENWSVVEIPKVHYWDMVVYYYSDAVAAMGYRSTEEDREQAETRNRQSGEVRIDENRF
ncbi:uncharacterized protein SETTUDRAFT_155922 [Exserohilum turcica Et28A]|uniref:FAD-binding domain-containing protein n=1 Tax=Exserohilum turcicum (strain 28A) TaxID=671987 RepID=R0K131_EXST2|nr:uncharacterized protein SETTUDRAFT_155922 [Exserohilum turcica Et28A]EOA83389.1 hypothetical protein SETTUDRAFT_155922 [Exserohilum turcica Et28A]